MQDVAVILKNMTSSKQDDNIEKENYLSDKYEITPELSKKSDYLNDDSDSSTHNREQRPRAGSWGARSRVHAACQCPRM